MSSEYSFSVQEYSLSAESSEYSLCPTVPRVQLHVPEYSLDPRVKFMLRVFHRVQIPEYSLCPVYVLRVQFFSSKSTVYVRRVEFMTPVYVLRVQFMSAEYSL